jgi:hypothetical protein
MTRITTVSLVALLTTAACAAIWLWALRPLGFSSYLTSTGAADAEIIRQYWPHRLVQPEWVTDVPSRLMNWHRTETAARLVVVLGLWFLISGGAVLGFVQRRKREPNQTRQPTPGEHLSCSRPPLAWRGCALRSACR